MHSCVVVVQITGTSDHIGFHVRHCLASRVQAMLMLRTVNNKRDFDNSKSVESCCQVPIILSQVML